MVDIICWLIVGFITYKCVSTLNDRLDSIDKGIKDIKGQMFTIDEEEGKEWGMGN